MWLVAPAGQGVVGSGCCRWRSLAGIGQGLRYALSRRDPLGTYLVDIAAMLLAMPVVLFPALAEEVFERPELLGLLYSAETVGALVATALSGWTARIHHHGRAIVTAAGGRVRAGLTADLWTVRGAIVSGGFACVAGVTLTAIALRDFWSYDERTDEHVLAEKATRAAAGES